MDVSVSLLSKRTDNLSHSQSEAEVELPTVYNLLGVGESYEYVIPSFCCLSMTLQHVCPICRPREGC